ncbi:FAD assembly factor SdhE [Acidimangrovimonas pyrenivorans]|uniref:FAD assembly factor SdhE n=1 Tax=Acidimangrovimonas pyrenivorans TaxID=2030798 RepID=A0ABV7ACB6_9RHOB
MSESPEDRLKRMKMRSWRRGTKEMDLILGPWADAHLAGLAPAALDLYEALLAENDQDLYPWITGQSPMPAQYAELLGEIGTFARARLGPTG